jgi:hypothetical protein
MPSKRTAVTKATLEAENQTIKEQNETLGAQLESQAAQMRQMMGPSSPLWGY